jgi:hypothetical protein
VENEMLPSGPPIEILNCAWDGDENANASAANAPARLAFVQIFISPSLYQMQFRRAVLAIQQRHATSVHPVFSFVTPISAAYMRRIPGKSRTESGP